MEVETRHTVHHGLRDDVHGKCRVRDQILERSQGRFGDEQRAGFQPAREESRHDESSFCHEEPEARQKFRLRARYGMPTAARRLFESMRIVRTPASYPLLSSRAVRAGALQLRSARVEVTQLHCRPGMSRQIWGEMPSIRDRARRRVVQNRSSW